MNKAVTHLDFDIDHTLAQFNATQWLDRYWEALSGENAKVNLVSRETKREDFRRMAAEALLPFAHYRPSTGSYLDIGSGGGIPSIPILLSGVSSGSVTLYERTKKKAQALERIVSALGLPGVSIIPESFGEQPLSRKFSLVTLSWVELTPTLFRAIESTMIPGATLVYYSHPGFKLSNATLKLFSYSQTSTDIHKFFSIITK